MLHPTPISTLFPYTTLFRSRCCATSSRRRAGRGSGCRSCRRPSDGRDRAQMARRRSIRSEEHTSELQSHVNLVCRLLLEKKKKENEKTTHDIGTTAGLVTFV